MKANNKVQQQSNNNCTLTPQDPDRHLQVRLSHFRATPFFLLHTSYRAVTLGLVAAFLPVWAWIIIISSLLVTNFIVTNKIFSMPKLYSSLTAITAIMTPSMYPTKQATHISILAKFQIINSISVAGVIVIVAIISNTFTMDSLVWHQSSHIINSINMTSSSVNETDLGPGHTPAILMYGVLPPVLVSSILYILIIFIIMGIIRPGFLELPPSQYSSRRASVNNRRAVTSSSSEEEEKLPVLEEEKLSNGLVIENGVEDISEIKTLTPKSDNQKDIIYGDIKYLDLLEGKETDL